MNARRTAAALALLACAACASPDDDVNRPPVAVAGKDQRAVLEGENVWIALDGEGSHDPDGDAIAWRWAVVRAPEPLVLGTEQRKEARPVVALPGPGLYVFSLVVEDERAPSTPDYVNVWVVDPAWADAGATDAGVPDPDADVADPDAGVVDIDAGVVENDAGVVENDAETQDAEVESLAPDASAGAAPVAVVDVEPSPRVAPGTPVRLSAARSRGEALAFRWALVAAPFGGTQAFRAEGAVVEFTPAAPGRHTVRLTVDDGERAATADVVVHATGGPAWVLDPRAGRAIPVGLDGEGVVGDPVALGDLTGAVGFSVRAGVLYATTRGGQGRPPRLVVAAPGRPVVRRVLPTGADPGPPAPVRDGVWVPMRDAPAVFFSDPEGAQPIGTVVAPAGRAWGADGAGRSVFVAQTGGLLEFVDRRFARVVFETAATCAARDVVAHDGGVYVGCEREGRVLRVAAAGEARPDRVDLSAGVARLVRAGDHLVAMPARGDALTIVPAARFDLPPDHPDRRAARQTVVPLAHPAVDLAARDDRAWVLVARDDGGVSLTTLDVPAARVLFAVRLPVAEGALLAIDAADDRDEAMDRL